MKLPFRLSPIDDSGPGLLERLDLLIELQRQTNVLLERVAAHDVSGQAAEEIGRPAAVKSASRSKRRTPAHARRQAASSPKPKDATKRSPSLHEEIEAVLREAGHPLPANVIADRIHERGHYTPPRSAKPLSGSNVNSRVANPTYRSRFVRRDDGIWLATPEGQSGGA